MGAQLNLTFAPEWDAIRTAWDPCMAFLSERGLDTDAAYALCMVTQELLENAVKYGSFGPGHERIHLQLCGGLEGVTVEVHSPLGAEAPDGLERLDSMIQWIRGFQNPFEAYVARLKDIAARVPVEGESGLGLVRMAYEGQCILDFYTEEAEGAAPSLAMSAVYLPRARHAAGPAGGTASGGGHAPA